jgi:hypothetical protein
MLLILERLKMDFEICLSTYFLIDKYYLIL